MKTRAHRPSGLLIVFLTGVLTAFSCEKNVAGAARGTLADVEVRVDWSLCRETPDAMTVLIYAEDGRLLKSKTSPETDGVHFRLPPGTYRSGVFSYSISQWKSLSLQGLERLETARAARACGLGLNAGHDLSLENLAWFIRTIPWTDEVSIGHALICDALYYGLEKTIQAYLGEIRKND